MKYCLATSIGALTSVLSARRGRCVVAAIGLRIIYLTKVKLSSHGHKEVVLGIRKRNGDLRFFHTKDAKSGTMAQYIRENISEDVEVNVHG